MPYAYLHKWNSGYNGEIYGAFSAKTVYFNHAATLDYDMALRTAGSTGTYIERPYEITAWRELTDPAERISF
jgi:5-formaminoimidazole-4-carboxamide-1-beta-D-ribofuranosyl 5'-monophosphate synthetase